MAKKKIIWLSYDLGLKGDYSNLYLLLDKWKARDCGPNLAVFEIDNTYGIGARANDFIKRIKSEIKKKVNLKESDRIYAIWKEDNSGKMGRILSRRE
jgi:hypothetical protein